MGCISPQRNHAAMLHLENRVHFLEGCLKQFRIMTGDAGGWPEIFLPMYAMTRTADGDSSQFTVLWGTWEATSFRVEESVDMQIWYPAADIVESTPGEVFTSWESGVYGVEETIYFRAVLLRPSLVCCALPDDGPLPRFFEKVIGPTGGSRYGGCTDCSGDFPVCDDELANLM